uniref:Uncharacterized protein n=1 Tax=Callorhinchus milii TaxID=7868 RepID=A0A4W3JEI7_CALMI
MLLQLTAADTSEAAVLRSLKQFISKPMKKILKQVISLILVWQAVENPSIHHHKQILPESLLNKIPKEWDYIPREIKRRESGKSFTRLVAQAVSIVIGNTPAAIASLPLPIKFLFNLVEKKLNKNNPDLRQTCLLWCFIMIVCQILEDGNAIEFLTSITIDRWSKEKLSLLSECLQTIMGQQKRSPNQIVQKVIHCLEKEKPKWIEDQLRKARRLCTESAFFTDEGSVLQEKGSLVELTEQKISMMVLDICHKPGGSEYLRQIYHIIQLNEDLLEKQLSSQNSLDDNGTSLKSLELTLLDLPQPMIFNPLQVFNHIGCKHFDQSAISEWNWDWSQLLHSNLGLSQLTFRALLANRWEMKADTPLEEKEKHMIEHLQTLYLNSNKGQ